MVIPTFSSGSFERTLLNNECLTGDSKSYDRRLQHRFLVLRKLGQGTYGKVQLAINKETNQEVAIKTIKKGKIESEEDMLRIRREIHIMKSIRHPYIIHIHEVFETRQKIVIVMQYASGGELYDYLGCHNSLPEEEARRIFRQIASAIYYCHKNKICHRDLKLENILLDDVGNAQIADFGLSNIFDEKRRMNTFCGSPLYASPEIVKGTPYKGPEVDCWSLGVLLYTLIYGTMPFDGRNFKELVTQISEGRYEEPSNKSSASTLIRRLLTPDISKRATITDVCLDSWVNEGYGTSLLNVAEKMALDANFKTKSLSLSKFALEQNGHEKVIPPPVMIVTKPNIIQNGTTPKTSNSLNGHNGEVSRNSDLYEQILNYDVKFIINKLLGAVESSVGVSQNTPVPPSQILPVKENGVSPLKPWPQNGENNVASKVESAYVIPIFEVTSVVPKTNRLIKKRNSVENTEQCSKQLPNGIIHKNNDGIIQKSAKSKLAIEKKDTPKESHEQTKTEQTILEKSTDKPQQKRQQDQSKNRRNNENFKFASKHLGPSLRNNALTLARIFSAKYERLVRTSIKLPERRRPVPGKLVIPSTFDPATASCNETTQKKEQILLFPTVSVSENKEKIEKKIDKIKKAALNRNLILRSNSENRLKIQKFLLSQAKKMQDFMCDEQRGGNGSMHHLNKCDIPPEVYHLFDKTPKNAFGARQHSKRINFNDFGKNCDFDLARRKIFRVNYLSIKDECCLSIAKSKSDVQFPTYFSVQDQASGNLLDVPPCATIQRSASDSEGLQIFRNAFEYIKHCENNKNDFEMSYKIPSSIYEQHLQDKGHFKVSSHLTEENIQDSSRGFMGENPHTNVEEENKAIQRSNSISICTDLVSMSSNFTFIKKHLPSFNTYREDNFNDLLNKDTVSTKNLKSFLSKVNVIYREQNELLNEKYIKRRNSLSSIPDQKRLYQDKKYHNLSKFGKDKDEISFKNHLAVLSEQSLCMNHSKNDANFLSSPSLYQNAFETLNQNRFNDSKSIDSLNSRLSSSIDSEEFDLLPSMRRSSQTSQFLRKILQDSYDDIGDSEIVPTRVRAKSLVEGTFSTEDMVRKLSNSHGVGQNSKFLSKFLNDLENREINGIKKDPKLNRNTRNLPLSGKRPKLEKKSQSFLQLLALKRIHEAEKELDKAERNHTVNAEEESAGSLLEALKTHGYKGVISQLSQESDNNSTDAYNTSSYLSRKRVLDMHRYNTSYYDPMQQFTYPSYDLNDLDLASYDALEFSPYYSNNLDLTPYNSLDSGYNNFDPTLNNLDQTPYNFELTPYNFDLTSYNTSDLTPYSNNLELTSYNNGLDETPYTSIDTSPYTQNFKSNYPKQYFSRISGTQPSEHRSKFTLEMGEEKSTSDTPNWERDPKPDNLAAPQEAQNEKGNQEPMKKYSLTELSNTYTPRTEKNPLLRTSSTSEDERESIQDRIWRKSFYSRFNNSALSRKERSSLMNSEFSPEVRANGICTPYKSSHRDNSRWQSSKRVETARKYSLTRDSSVASSRSRQRSYDISDENISKMDSDI